MTNAAAAMPCDPQAALRKHPIPLQDIVQHTPDHAAGRHRDQRQIPSPALRLRQPDTEHVMGRHSATILACACLAMRQGIRLLSTTTLVSASASMQLRAITETLLVMATPAPPRGIDNYTGFGSI
ncbi:hypothetical protein [Rhodoferax sediminis]|uniref:Uncharacterized protein n=1 Tax=Rhodoferax sediminis TaxID=2509614 RepID=A0A515D7R6_9BURK|nr:hypothetical protein [Rhodoferax sediminis]QDL36455.1 hypothetical protein EUB48_03445 [Rhodoferax sediminis]